MRDVKSIKLRDLLLVIHTTDDIQYNLAIDSFHFRTLKSKIMRDFPAVPRKKIFKYIKDNVPDQYLNYSYD